MPGRQDKGAAEAVSHMDEYTRNGVFVQHCRSSTAILAPAPLRTMDSTSSAESLDAWQSISVYSNRLLQLTADPSSIQAPCYSPITSGGQATTKPSAAILFSVAFPAPPDIASDFVALGFRFDVAQDLSSNYSRAIHTVREAYEEQYDRTNEACTRIAALANGALLPNLLSRLRESFVTRYTSLQYRWAREAILIAQQSLCTRSLTSPRALTVSH